LSQNIIDRFEKHFITKLSPKYEPIVVNEGIGAIVKDVEGKEYLDCWAGVAVVNAGHCNPEVTEAVRKQVGKLVHCCIGIYYTETGADLSLELAQITPGAKLTKTFLGNSGAEAIECAIKAAKKCTKRHEIIALMYSFHCRTLATLSVTGIWSRRRYDMGPYIGAVAFAPPPYCYRCVLGLEYPSCGIQCAKMIDNTIVGATSNSVAAFIAEPVMGEGGIITPPVDYFKVVESILDAHDILFIADEVQTGFGRTGKMFGIENFGVVPDIMGMSKGIANGMPLGACSMRPEIAEAFEAGDHATTLGGNPVSCAAALATINYIIKNDLPGQAAKKGEYALKRLKEIATKYPLVGDVRGRGLMIGLELVKDQKTKTPAKEEAGEVRVIARNNRVLVGIGGVFGNVIRIQPPLVITEEQIDHAVDIVDMALKETCTRSI
jgi:4-aminobutyrate aminotransferase/(S)-3-amino-2-methylpropionate transaminase